MTIVELACLKLKPGLTSDDTVLLKCLVKTKQILEDYSHLPTLFYSQVEDPTIMYVIGSWETPDQHSKGFSGSEGQMEILNLGKDLLAGIPWMYYLDVEHPKLPLDAPMLAIRRYFLKTGVEKQSFIEACKLGRRKLKELAQGSVGAWNLPKDEQEKNLWVQFAGWNSLEDEREAEFANSQEAVESTKALQDMIEMEESDIKHATKVQLP